MVAAALPLILMILRTCTLRAIAYLKIYFSVLFCRTTCWEPLDEVENARCLKALADAEEREKAVESTPLSLMQPLWEALRKVNDRLARLGQVQVLCLDGAL